MWKIVKVSWTGITKLCASVPSDPEIVKAWLDSRKPRVRPPSGRSIDEVQEEVFASLAVQEEEAASNILVFQRHEERCCQRAATIKAHMKDCSRRISARLGKIQGEAAFSTKVINYVYPDEMTYWVPILRPDGSAITKHDGEMDRSISTRFGTAIKRFEWIEPWRLDFTLKILALKGKSAVNMDDLDTLFSYGGVHGYGGERGNGEGKYTFTLKEEN